MSTQVLTDPTLLPEVNEAVAEAARVGLSDTPKWLPAWLFYDAQGSRLFERITVLPEYYLTRTERAIFTGYADGIVQSALDVYKRATGDSSTKKLRMLELGAGTATKTGILLDAAVRRQGTTEYLPVDVSASAIEEACGSIANTLQGVNVVPQVANYVTDELHIPDHDGPTLALYIGSSIGNFSTEDAVAVLQNLRAQLKAGDTLLLGTDLAKDPAMLIAAYNDADCVTEAFNLNILRRLNRDLRASFDLACFRHLAVWNASKSRIEMHLQSTRAQTVRMPLAGASVSFHAGETIHTENSYKFTKASVESMLQASGFHTAERWTDERNWFAVTLAEAI